jgi:hypothetical protein
MLSDEEIIRRLKEVRHSSISDRVAGRSTSIAEIARCSGVTNMHIYCIINGTYQIGPKSREGLSRALLECKVEDGERTEFRPDRSAAFGTGSGGVFTVKWPDFGPERPRKRGMR